MRTLTRPLGALGAAALALALLACGGDDDGGTDAIASLGGETTTTDGGGGGGGSRLSDEQQALFEEAALEHAQCMRDHGIDFPDPQFDDGGRVTQRMGRSAEVDREAIEAAEEECAPIMEEVQAQLPQPSAEEQAERQQEALELAECMREHGIEDFPDPQFDEGGRISIAIGGGSGPMSEREQDEMDAAMEACGGPGGPGVAGSASSRDSGDG